MNIFRNPIVVGILAVVAVAIVAYQFFPSIFPSIFHSSSPRTVAAPGPQPAPAPVKATNTPNPAPAPAPAFPPQAALAVTTTPLPMVNSNYAQSHLGDWIKAPQHDPFLQAKSKDESAATSAPPWKVTGIWRQNGVALAAINHGIYRPGDVLEGYTITAINDNEVSLEKNGEPTSVSFGFGLPQPSTAAGPK